MTTGTHVYTTNLKAAAALCTLGFNFSNENPVTRIIRADGKESTVFWFENLNDKGEKASSVLSGMTSGADALNESDPENIINYLRAFAANRDTLIDIIRSTPRLIQIERNGKKIAVYENASAETKAKIAARI